MPDDPSLGTCCGCEGTRNVRNIFFLTKKSPIPGRGWGCVICHAPSDGALAVLCDKCSFRAEIEGLDSVLRFACRGNPGTDGRIPIGELTGCQDHDLKYHPEIRPEHFEEPA